MAESPIWKVYNAEGVYLGCTKEPEAAALLCQFYGDGATVRHGHRTIVWTEGADAYDSWDDVSTTIHRRAAELRVERRPTHAQDNYRALERDGMPPHNDNEVNP